MTNTAGIENNTNAEWQQRKNNAIARGEGNLAPVYIEHAKNAEMWDVEGNRYIDFATGIAVCNTGHSHPRIVEAVKEQVDRFSHTCVMVTPYSSAVRLAEKLNEIAPGDSPKKTMFVSTGAEAVENAVKIARAHTGRRAVISFDGGYHGRTNFTLGLTGKVTPYKTGFGPFPADIYRVPFPIPYHGIDTADSLRALETLFTCDVAPSDVAAIILEPVQGEGGFYPAPNELLTELRSICDKHGILLIMDEIQTGFARTGRIFCTEYAEIEPDLITVAKGMGGGYPIAGVTGKADIMDAPLPGGLGGTYAGSPVACAAALAVLDIIEEEKLTDKARHIGEQFGKCLNALKERHPQYVGDVRADRGAMVAMEFIHDGDADKPNPQLPEAILTRAREKGLILLKCGVRGNVLRFLPALTIEEETLQEGLDILVECISELVS